MIEFGIEFAGVKRHSLGIRLKLRLSGIACFSVVSHLEGYRGVLANHPWASGIEEISAVIKTTSAEVFEKDLLSLRQVNRRGCLALKPGAAHKAHPHPDVDPTMMSTVAVRATRAGRIFVRQGHP